jgi:hypothetical protein
MKNLEKRLYRPPVVATSERSYSLDPGVHVPIP